MLCYLEKTELNFAIELYAKIYSINNIAAQAVIEGFADSVLAQKDDCGIAAILCVSKLNIGTATEALLHGAACRDPSHNGQIAALIKHAVASVQADNIFIIPKDEFTPQAKDMSNTVVARMLKKEIKRNLWAKADFDTVTAKKLCKYREKYISEKYACFSIQQTAALLTCLYSQGISSAETANAYALYYRTAECLVVVEIYATTDVEASLLLEAMANHEGRYIAKLTLSQNNSVFAGEGKRFNCASYSGAEIANNELYIGPMPK